MAACGAEAPQGTTRVSQAEPDLQTLAALGYADWDPVVDEAAGGDGVAILDPDRAQPGVTLYTDEVDRVLAVDLAGEVVRDWTIPGRSQVTCARPLGGGRLVAVSVDEGVTLVDGESRALWALDLNAHHDVAALIDGTFLVPVWEERSHRGRRVRFDLLVAVSALGERLWTWDSFEQLDELQRLHPPLALDTAAPPGPDEDATVYDYYHLNTVQELGQTALASDPRFAPGNLLLCLRNANLVLILDRETLAVAWSWRPGTLDMPHTPSLLAGGTLLIFDNGHHRGYSRLLEVDPRDGRRVWSWQADPPESFFTQGRGSAQRLANGNTLACEAERGRVIEITPEGEVVWDFRNPIRRGDARKRIYRALRYDRDLLF